MATMMPDEDEQKPPEPQPGASPTIAPDQNFGFQAGGEGAPKAPTAEPTTQTMAATSQPASGTNSYGFAATSAAPGSTQGYMESGLNQFLQTPSRYDAGVVQQGAKVIEDSLAKIRKQGKQGIAEGAASRGLVGSSIEMENNRQFEEELQRQANEQMFNLMREQANTYGADRAASLSAGLQFGNQALAQMGMGMDDRFRQMQLDLQRQGMSADDAYRAAALQWQQQYGTSELGIRQQGADNQYNLALATLLMNPAFKDTLSTDEMRDWIKGYFDQQSVGSSGDTRTGQGAGTETAPAAQSQVAGSPPVAQSGMFGDIFSQLPPEFWQQYTNQTGQTPYTPNQGGTPTSGYQPFGFQINDPGDPYGMVGDAQRKLGITGGSNLPMPNGVTSPVGGGQPGVPGNPSGLGGGGPVAPPLNTHTGSWFGFDEPAPGNLPSGAPVPGGGPTPISSDPSTWGPLEGKSGTTLGGQQVAVDAPGISNPADLLAQFGMGVSDLGVTGLLPKSGEAGNEVNLGAVNAALNQRGYLLGARHPTGGVAQGSTILLGPNGYSQTFGPGDIQGIRSVLSQLGVNL